MQVSILSQLAALLALCHNSALAAERFCPLRPSSIRILPVKGSTPGDTAAGVSVRVAPPAQDQASGSFCRSRMARCLQDADELCTPDVAALHPRVCECMRTDVWRLGALGAVLMAVHVYGEDAPQQLARAGNVQLLLGDLMTAMGHRPCARTGVLDAIQV